MYGAFDVYSHLVIGIMNIFLFINISALGIDIQQLYRPPDVEDGADFGGGLAMNRQYLVIGASNDEHSTLTDAGSAHIYKYNETNGERDYYQQLTAYDPEDGARYGESVAIQGEYIMVTSFYSDAPLLNSGCVYVYRLNNSTNLWEFHQKLTASDAAENDRFGQSVNIDGQML